MHGEQPMGRRYVGGKQSLFHGDVGKGLRESRLVEQESEEKH